MWKAVFNFLLLLFYFNIKTILFIWLITFNIDIAYIQKKKKLTFFQKEMKGKENRLKSSSKALEREPMSSEYYTLLKHSSPTSHFLGTTTNVFSLSSTHFKLWLIIDNAIAMFNLELPLMYNSTIIKKKTFQWAFDKC